MPNRIRALLELKSRDESFDPACECQQKLVRTLPVNRIVWPDSPSLTRQRMKGRAIVGVRIRLASAKSPAFENSWAGQPFCKKKGQINKPNQPQKPYFQGFIAASELDSQRHHRYSIVLCDTPIDLSIQF